MPISLDGMASPHPGDEDPAAALACDLEWMLREIRAIRTLTERARALVAAEKMLARQRMRAGVAASATTAMLTAGLAATAFGLSLSGMIVTGLIAGTGSFLPGFILIVRPDLLDRVFDWWEHRR